MYSPAACAISPTIPPYRSVTEPVTGEDSKVFIATFSRRTTLTNEVTPSEHHVTISIDLSEVIDFDLRDDSYFPIPSRKRKPVVKNVLREIASPWQAKWRLSQQRPRDGI